MRAIEKGIQNKNPGRDLIRQPGKDIP